MNRGLVLAVLAVFPCQINCARAENDEEWCDRFSAMELKESLFNVQLERELDVIKTAFDLTIQDLETMLEGLTAKNKGKIDTEAITKGEIQGGI